MFTKKRIVFLTCDKCGSAQSPRAPSQLEARRLAEELGWKTWGIHVCTSCFAAILQSCSSDRGLRARLALERKSGETTRDLAAEWGVSHQTAINWARRGAKRERQRGQRRVRG